MKTIISYRTILIALFALLSLGVWAATETITITLNSIGGSAVIGTSNYDGGAERIWTQNSVTFGGKAITANPTNSPANATTGTYIQAQANNGVIYNTTPLPGRIVSITLSQGGTARSSSCYGGTSRLVNDVAANYTVTGGTQVESASTTGWTSTNFSGKDYTYFAVKRGANAAYFSSIVIEYEVAAASNINWANLQHPEIGTITLGEDHDVYGQIYQPGVTDQSGQGANIAAWVGYSTSNSNPSTWENWVEASYNKDVGNNDEYETNLGAALTASGTYYYAYRYQYDGGGYYYGGYNGGAWDGNNNVSGVLTVNKRDIGWGNVETTGQSIFYPSNEFIVYGEVHIDGITNKDKPLHPLLKAWVGVTTDNNKNPDSNSGDFVWIPAEYHQNNQGESNNNHKYIADIHSALTATGNYYYVYRYQFGDNGDYYYGGTGGEWNSGSKNFGTLEVKLEELNWGNLQHPGSGNMFVGGEFNVYGWAYHPGLTPDGQNGEGITAWIGVNTSNENPANWSENSWTLAAFDKKEGDNDNNYQYIADLGQIISQAGTYYYAFRYKLGDYGPYQYGGYKENAGGFWDGTTNVNGVLTVQSLDAPVATAATNITDTSFQANWEEVTDISNYKLRVSSGGILIDEDFSAITAGNNTSTNGSSSPWLGNDNFPTVNLAYQAGSAVRIGNGSNPGSITSKELDLSKGGSLSFDVKGWTTVEGDILITVDDGTAQTITYTAKMADPFETKTISLPVATSSSTVTIATSAKRAFITNVEISNIAEISGSPFSISNETSKVITGLDPLTTYYYAVKSVLGNSESAWSNEITVKTKPAAPVATAATEITTNSFQANWENMLGIDSYNLEVMGYLPVFTENFNTQSGTGGNDGLWSGNIASSGIDNLSSWTLESAGAANRCIKLGTTSAQGSAQTPTLNLDGDAVLTFRAGAWNSTTEQTELLLEISGGGSLSASSVTLVKGEFNEYTVNITGGTANTKITFKGKQATYSRFFLDDVDVRVKTELPNSPFSVSDNNYKEITGLDEKTTYFYRVQAVAGEDTSAWSNEIQLTTLSSDKSIQVDEDNLYFHAEKDETFTHTINIITEYLTTDMQFAITGTDASLFSYQLDGNFDMLLGGNINITYSPTSIGKHSAKLAISSEEAEVEIDLKASAVITENLVFYVETFGEGTGTTALSEFSAWHHPNTTVNNGGYAQYPDIRITQASTETTQLSYELMASGGNNIFFNTTDEGVERGFVMEGIDASNYRNIQLQFGYYKHSGSVKSVLDVYYYNGSQWTLLDYAFVEKSSSTIGWYGSPVIQLPADAQISNLKLKFVKPASFYDGQIRIDDVWVRAEHKIMDIPVTNDAYDINISNFKVSWESYTAATKYLLDISESEDFSQGNEETIVAWAYASEANVVSAINTSENNASPSFANVLNEDKKLTTTATGCPQNPTLYKVGSDNNLTNNPPAVASSGWNEGVYKKYFQIEVNTEGYNNITLSSWHTSSGTGPKFLQAQYKIKANGDWLDIPNGLITVTSGNNYTNSSKLEDIPLPSACDNQETVYIRWVMSSTVKTSIDEEGDNTCQIGGTSRIANLYIKGKPENPANDFSSKEFTSTSTTAENMKHSTTYYYRIRAVAGNNVSNASLVKQVTTENGLNEWTGANSTNWSTASNWSLSVIPTSEYEVEIPSGKTNYPVIGSETSAAIKQLTIQENAKLQINAGGSLTVTETIINNNGTSGIHLKAASDKPNASLIFHNSNEDPSVKATVEMYSPASWGYNEQGNITNTKWQYFGIPFERVDNIEHPFYGSAIRKYNEAGWGTTVLPDDSGRWIQLNNYSALEAIQGYEIAQHQPKIYTMSGTLYNKDIDNLLLAYTTKVDSVAGEYPGQHILANPYSAAIDIKKIQFNNATTGHFDPTIFLYNTGSYADWTGGIGNSAGQYTAAPKEIEAPGSGIPTTIPSMQGFLVRMLSPSALTIPYSAVIKNTEQQRSPQAPNAWLRVTVESETSGDRLWLISDPATTVGFDNGWDGRKLAGAAGTPLMYTWGPAGNLQINAQPDIHDTNIAFRAGNDSEYTLTFNHGGGMIDRHPNIYLKDNELNRLIDVSEDGATYSFTSDVRTGAGSPRFKIVTSTDGHDISSVDEVNIRTEGNIFYIDNISANPLTITVYDISGRRVLEHILQTGESYNMNNQLPSGSYIIRAAGKEVKTHKIICR